MTALKGMLKQVKELPVAWRLSRRDGVIWLVTFLAVVLVDIDFGLGVGIIVSLASILLASHKPYIHQLGHLPDTEIYLEMDRYHKVSFCLQDFTRWGKLNPQLEYDYSNMTWVGFCLLSKTFPIYGSREELTRGASKKVHS